MGNQVRIWSQFPENPNVLTRLVRIGERMGSVLINNGYVDVIKTPTSHPTLESPSKRCFFEFGITSFTIKPDVNSSFVIFEFKFNEKDTIIRPKTSRFRGLGLPLPDPDTLILLNGSFGPPPKDGKFIIIKNWVDAVNIENEDFEEDISLYANLKYYIREPVARIVRDNDGTNLRTVSANYNYVVLNPPKLLLKNFGTSRKRNH